MGLCNSTPPEFDDQILIAAGYPGERVSVDTYIDGDSSTSVGPHKLRVSSWLPTGSPRAVVIVCHGLHEHGLRYYGVAHALSAQGMAVYACDHYAHGKSGGERGLVTDYKVLVDDFVAFAQWVKSRHPGLPMSLLGHSMGSLISTLSINRIGSLQSVVFSANPIYPGPGAASPQGIKPLFPLTQTAVGRALVGVVARLDPKGPACPIDMDGITNDLNEQDIILKDPYRYADSVRNITAFNLLQLIKDAVAEYPLLKVPFMCIHGTSDTIASVVGSRELYMSASTPWRDRNLNIYSGARHELFHGPAEEQQRCIGDVAAYLVSTVLGLEQAIPRALTPPSFTPPTERAPVVDSVGSERDGDHADGVLDQHDATIDAPVQ